MKCEICGAELKKEGNICKKCYAQYVKDEEIKSDIKNNKNVLLRLHRKYIPFYQLTRYGDYYVLALIIVFSLLAQKLYLYTFLAIFLIMIIFYSVLAYNKNKAIKTTCTFYDKRVVWKYKDNIKSLDYSNIDDVKYYQNFFQKKFHLADVQFRPKKGSYIMNGFEIKNVPNFNETWDKICDIIISKREN
ncbi:MAG: hypothetical protein IKM97_02655 [Clostridia bacterium]|nr:hypothetical protein [Clostridia bacterium]